MMIRWSFYDDAFPALDNSACNTSTLSTFDERKHKRVPLVVQGPFGQTGTDVQHPARVAHRFEVAVGWCGGQLGRRHHVQVEADGEVAQRIAQLPVTQPRRGPPLAD